MKLLKRKKKQWITSKLMYVIKWMVKKNPPERRRKRREPIHQLFLFNNNGQNGPVSRQRLSLLKTDNKTNTATCCLYGTQLHPRETEKVNVTKRTGLPWGPLFENPPTSAGNTGLISGPGRVHPQQGPRARHHHCWARAPQREKPPRWEASIAAETQHNQQYGN